MDAKAFAAGVGDVVRRARQAQGWTQAELAQQAGFSPNYIARLERGELGPSLFVAHQLCETLAIDLSDLVHVGNGASAASGARAVTRTARRRAHG